MGHYLDGASSKWVKNQKTSPPPRKSRWGTFLEYLRGILKWWAWKRFIRTLSKTSPSTRVFVEYKKRTAERKKRQAERKKKEFNIAEKIRKQKERELKKKERQKKEAQKKKRPRARKKAEEEKKKKVDCSGPKKG